MNAHYSLLPEAVAITDAGSKDAILEELSRFFAEVYDLEAGDVHEVMHRREALGSTGFGRGVAMPHARISGLKRPVAAVLRLDSPVDFDAADGAPVELVFGLLSPEQAGATHLHALASISRTIRDERVHGALLNAPNAEAIYSLLSNVSDRDAA